ncbi:MAG: septal ring lytic transglycosylase RlpA family protein [Candidatus Aminicenantes bacterium]|nr:septal ring lytic transglycosylase RlpA family protein [Candidatus Aminicenantes bacterium]
MDRFQSVMKKYPVPLIYCLIICLLALMFSCSRTRYIPRGNIQTGLASWYGPDFHGKKTSSQEIYNMYELTAAHKSLPFGTYVMVTNLDNGKSVRVRINDRGPFVRGRIIDLSYAAARVLDMIGQGVVRVRIEVLSRIPRAKSGPRFSVQVGAFVSRENAEALKLQIQKIYQNVYISTIETSNQVYYRVRIGAKSLASAHEMARELFKQGFTVIVLEES